MRLIDADALIEKEERYELDRYIDGERCYEMAVPSCAIIEAPTIEPKQADDIISRADAIEAIKSNVVAITPTQIDAVADCIECVESIPSAQPKIVRCKDCKFNYGNEHNCSFNPDDIVCTYWESDGLQSDDFCSYGERQTERSE